MKILSVDLGKFKSDSCLYQKDAGRRDSAEFQTVATDRRLFRQLIAKSSADVIVSETCTVARLAGRPV